jgi:hypothetical protein
MQNVNAIRRSPIRGARTLLAFSACLLGACASSPPPFPELPQLDVATQIKSSNMCGLGVSPAISIGKAPEATARYRIRMTNVDVLFQEPWQTTAPARPGGYLEGALPDYQAPCVGDLSLYIAYPYYIYRFEVLALDSQDRPLAYGQITVPVRNISTLLEQERAARSASPAAAPPPPPLPPLPPTIGPLVNPALQPRLPGPTYEP